MQINLRIAALRTSVVSANKPPTGTIPGPSAAHRSMPWFCVPVQSTGRDCARERDHRSCGTRVGARYHRILQTCSLRLLWASTPSRSWAKNSGSEGLPRTRGVLDRNSAIPMSSLQGCLDGPAGACGARTVARVGHVLARADGGARTSTADDRTGANASSVASATAIFGAQDRGGADDERRLVSSATRWRCGPRCEPQRSHRRVGWSDRVGGALRPRTPPTTGSARRVTKGTSRGSRRRANAPTRSGRSFR